MSIQSVDPISSASNADQAELEKFSALASRWWDPTSEFRPLHEINPLRLTWINSLHPLAGQRVLDVGCGGGILAESMARAGANVTGIDLAEKSLAVAKLHGLESGVQVDYRAVSTEAFALEQPESFDLVCCMEMLEHVPEPASVIAACAQLAKPGGHVVFSTLNRNPKSFLFAIVGAEYVLNLLPRGTHTYGSFIKPSELRQMAESAGLQALQMTGLHYNPFTRVYRLGGNVDVNYLFAFHRPDSAPAGAPGS